MGGVSEFDAVSSQPQLNSVEASLALIALTKNGVRFNGAANDGKGALVFEGLSARDSARAFVTLAGIAYNKSITSFEVSSPGGKTHYEVHDAETVKRMCGYCDRSPQRSVG